MDIRTTTQEDSDYPLVLMQMHQPPAALYSRGRELADIMSRPRVAIVGSRAISPYGRQVTRRIAKQLASQGVVIVSGLAMGVDAEAHRAALDVGGITMAVLPVPVNRPAPPINQKLAAQIIAEGGTLLSTYAADTQSNKGHFVERNEIVAALSQAVVITEAAQGSGSLHTAKFALDLGVQTMAVPGNITSRTSEGTNRLIKAGNAAAVTSADDILRELGLGFIPQLSLRRGDTPEEQQLIDLIAGGIADGHQLQEQSGQPISTFNQTLTMLEIAGKIVPLGANHWGLG